jgi:YD repeat-containing protein
VTVWFNSAGQHDSTVNRLGHRTTFAYTSGRLTTITLPSQGGGQTYTFGYDGSNHLSSVTAPGARLTTVRVIAERVDSIRDPDNTRVGFSYESPSSRRIAARTDRRLNVTSYSYDAAKKLSRASIALSGDSIRVGFRGTDVQGLLTATPKTATDTANVYTSFFGARHFTTGPDSIGQETKFWLDRFGAPRRIVNPLGQQTLVKREDAEWPVLATELTAANGFVMRAGYDARGNIVRATAVNPLGDPSPGPEDDAITRYHWNSTWDFVDSVVTPTGVRTTLAYDAANGNRLWQQVGSDASRRVTFAYYTSGPEAGLLRATQLPDVPGGGTARDSVVYSTGLVNLAATRTPLGFWTSYYTDAVGRDTLIVTPIDSTDVSRGGAADSTSRLRQRTVYTVMDDDSVSQTIAPNRVQTLSVEKSRDPEGNVLSLSRWSTPDLTNIDTITTRWRYDRANRAVAEIAPDDSPTTPRVDSTEYDPAGNVVKVLTRRYNPSGGARLAITMTYDALNRPTQRTLPQVHYGQRLDGIPLYQSGANVPNTPYPFYPTDGGSGYLVPADVAAFTYDVTGGLRTADNGSARIAREYYPNGALKADTQRIRTVTGSDFNQHKYVLQYRYDLDGRRVDLIHPSQLAAGAPRDRTTLAYEPITGLPSSVTDLMGDVFQMGYDFRGQLTSLTSPGGISESDTYDADGRRRTELLLNGSTSTYKWPEPHLRNATYGYDARGKIARVYNTAGTADTLFTQYSGLGHLVRDSMRTRGQASVVYPFGGIGPFPIKYDAWETFSLDALGNLCGAPHFWSSFDRNSTMSGRG